MWGEIRPRSGDHDQYDEFDYDRGVDPGRQVRARLAKDAFLRALGFDPDDVERVVITERLVVVQQRHGQSETVEM